MLTSHRPPAVIAGRAGQQYEREAQPFPAGTDRTARLVGKHEEIGNLLRSFLRWIEHREVHSQEHLLQVSRRQRFEKKPVYLAHASSTHGEVVGWPINESGVPRVVCALGARGAKDDTGWPDAAYGERLGKQRPTVEPQRALVDPGDPGHVEGAVRIDDEIERREERDQPHGEQGERAEIGSGSVHVKTGNREIRSRA